MKKRCKGKTKVGCRCRRNSNLGKEYCWTHVQQNIDAKESTPGKMYINKCPVCLEDEGDMLRLSCSHYIHDECSMGLTSSTCPICRGLVDNWPDEILTQIIINEDERRQELLDEEHDVLVEENGEVANFLNEMLHPPPQLEIISAIRFLTGTGIPYRYIPQQVNVTIDQGQPQADIGTLFSATIGQVLEQMQDDIASTMTDDESSSSDNDDPFDDENQESIQLNRSIRFIRESQN